MRMDELYPAHAKALKKCKPGAGHLPTQQNSRQPTNGLGCQ